MMPKKILCICNGGNVRSVALAQYIKDLNGIYIKLDDKTIKYEAIAIGKDVTTTKTMKYLKRWSDYIVDVSDTGEYSFGEDVWHNPRNPELIKKIEKIWKSVEEKI